MVVSCSNSSICDLVRGYRLGSLSENCVKTHSVFCKYCNESQSEDIADDSFVCPQCKIAHKRDAITKARLLERQRQELIKDFDLNPKDFSDES